jgi:hypothetical protein
MRVLQLKSVRNYAPQILNTASFSSGTYCHAYANKKAKYVNIFNGPIKEVNWSMECEAMAADSTGIGKQAESP